MSKPGADDADSIVAEQVVEVEEAGPNVGALIIRIGFGGIL